MKFGNTELVLKQGDICTQEVDIVVNAANSGLMGGGGVDGAIHRAGGPSILEQCKCIRAEFGKCPAGRAVITGAGDLQAKYVIHAVGPIWTGGSKGEENTLRSAYQSSLELAVSKKEQAVAFPSISTGAYRYPIDPAARVALRTCIEYCLEGCELDEIRFVLFSQADFQVYENALIELAALYGSS